MILGTSSGIFDATKFQEFLQAAMRGVFRIVADGSSYTGWLLTPELVLILSHFSNENASYLCYPYGSFDAPVQARLVARSDQEEGGVLRLERPVNIPHLTIQGENCTEGDSIMILHYPGGYPTLKLSFGRITNVHEKWINYNADTERGSTGGPVINMQNGKVVGMHLMSTPNRETNVGPSVAAILGYLRTTSCWREVAASQGILDTKSVQIENIQFETASPQWKQIHYKAAVQWNIDATKLTEVEKETLRSSVVNSNGPVWVLKPSDREQILTAVPIEQLRQVEAAVDQQQPGQHVIKKILQRGPIHLEELSTQELTYWLQAVRWFRPVNPGLPEPAQVNRILEKKRVRDSLLLLGGGDFGGRETELKKLSNWYADAAKGPMVISGIGGIGKTALISHFALQLPENTPILWLDFDRADLTPDDAPSILKILSEQVTVQVPMFVDPTNKIDWKSMAEEWGKNLQTALAGFPAPLLILDGFEVAQYAKQYHEIWKVMELILNECPVIRIIISGRAPVSNLTFCGKAADYIELKGMEAPHAESMLSKSGLKAPAVITKVAEISKGIPLILKLAIHYINKGGEEKDLVRDLPQTAVEGYLYRRILDRVMDPSLQPMAREGLILRKITIDIINQLLPHHIPAGSTAEEAFDKLSREMTLVVEGQAGIAMVSKNDVLQLRPEVHASTIRLLEIEDAAFVKKVDNNAVDYYKKQDLTGNENAAELVYHLLRLGRLPEAKKEWRPVLAPLLKYAVDDLPELNTRERNWLGQQLSEVITEAVDDITIWEQDTLKSLQKFGSLKGFAANIQPLLNYRKERSDNSPLLIYDAVGKWYAGELQSAIELLENSKATDPWIKNDQLIMLALLETKNNNRGKATDCLLKIDTKQRGIRHLGFSQKMAIDAARIRLAINLDDELLVMEAIRADKQMRSRVIDQYKLKAQDVMLPSLIRALDETANIDLTYSSKEYFANLENNINLSNLEKNTNDQNDSFLLRLFYQHNSPSIQEIINATVPDLSFRITRLRYLSGLRWNILVDGSFIGDIVELTTKAADNLTVLQVAIIFSLIVIHGREVKTGKTSFNFRLFDALIVNIAKRKFGKGLPPLETDRKDMAIKFIEQESDHFMDKGLAQFLTDSIKRDTESDRFNLARYVTGMKDPMDAASLLYLLGPDPLEYLCKSILGIPDEEFLFTNEQVYAQNEIYRLIDTLARVIRFPEQMQFYLSLVETNAPIINPNQAPITAWASIVEHARRTNQLGRLLEVIKKDYPGNTDLMKTFEYFL